MVNANAPPVNILSQAHKFYALPSITSLKSLKLDLTKSNYSSWCFFFKNRCERDLIVLDHIKTGEASTRSEAIAPPTAEWLKVDTLVKSWIFLTCSGAIVARLVKANPKTALEAWPFLEKSLPR